ncbi:carboxylesterase 1D [Cephus cinctus]|uniref:Carboxylesterase 1D n=1 Tax=Cephus cinctus TaxID=211228 RepID=A0AAJ7BV41_CEPCN|nr:carboxylesterase 1D [Cephus cinctus]XP_015595175.2 carboxylesterase 1D [Cephus cinctus]
MSRASCIIICTTAISFLLHIKLFELSVTPFSPLSALAMLRPAFTFLLVFLTLIVNSKCLTLLKRQKRIVGGITAAQPPEDDPVVFVNKNNHDARVYGMRDPKKGFYVFRGIRFGEPPVGRSRFQRPKAANLEGEFNATRWAAPCPQPNKDKNGKIIGSEDCLFLNVFTPMLPDSGDGYPVLIWIHGGGFRRGAACQYEMRNLIKKKMVVVSIQFRLGSLGFLSTGTKELPGNNAMFDMTLAINWVRNYIEYFGGNPKKIIAFGHGTGASSAIMLSLSKLTKNFFTGLIAMSGSILSNFAIDKDPMRTAKYIASQHDCPTDYIPDMVQCLRELSVEQLLQVDSKLETARMVAQGFLSGLSTLLGPGPVIEGSDDERSLPNFMTETPEVALKMGNFPEIPLLTGVMKDETGGAIFGSYKSEIEKKLKIPNFLNKDLVQNLQSTIPIFGNVSNPFSFEAFRNYFNVFNGNQGYNEIAKVSEAVGDALYNVPAFLTSEHWSKKAKTFLYSFDHKGQNNYAKDFLAGLPIVDAKTSKESTAHGDELGYIFGRNSITGQEIPDENNLSEDDKHVTDVFTDMIATFAWNGKPVLSHKSNNGTQMFSTIPQFSDDKNRFISISSKSELKENFRYCQMALWAGITNRLGSVYCNLFNGTVEFARNIGNIKNIVPNVILGTKILNTKSEKQIEPEASKVIKETTSQKNIQNAVRNLNLRYFG